MGRTLLTGVVKNRKNLKKKQYSVIRRLFLRKINLENRGGCGIMDSVMCSRADRRS